MTQEPSAGRAGDEDRSVTVDALREAYVQGQIDSEEREERVGHALQARHLSDLSGLLGDLRGPGVRDALLQLRGDESSPVEMAAPVRSRTHLRRLAVGAAVVAALAAATGMAVLQGGSDVSGGPDPVMDAQVQPAQGAQEGVLSDASEALRTQIDAWRDEYGAAFTSVELTWTVDSDVPQLRASTLRHEPDAAEAPTRLDDIDVERLIENLVVARVDLGVAEAESATVTITAESGLITIRVENRDGDAGEIETTLGGDVTEQRPAS